MGRGREERARVEGEGGCGVGRKERRYEYTQDSEAELTCKKLDVCEFHFSSGLPCHVFKILRQTYQQEIHSAH